MSDPDAERLAERVRAVERAVTGSDSPPAELADAAEATDRIATLEERIDGVEERLAELEAATEALRGYVGNVRSVNEDVERRAETALSMARSLQSGEGARATDGGGPGSPAPGSAEGPHGSAHDAEGADHERWSEATGPWEPAGTTSQTDANGEDGRPRSPDAEAPEPESSRATARGSTGVETSGTSDATAGRDPAEWPTGTERTTDDAREEWPREGMDVERAQPWAVPDPGAEEWDHDDDRTLLDRVREAL